LERLEGDEATVLGKMKDLLQTEDPDVIVLDDTTTIKWITQRASQHGLSLGFGREAELTTAASSSATTAGRHDLQASRSDPKATSPPWGPAATGRHARPSTRQCYERHTSNASSSR
jgi:hypothetical protein